MVTLVTGAGGFLGGHIADHLTAAGDEVVRAGRPWVEIPSADLDALIDEYPPGLVVHCATPASVPASVEDPEADRRGSAGVLAALLDRLAALPAPPRIVFVSSAAVYGQPATLPVAEDAERAPISPYGRHRAECEDLLREGPLPAVSLRVFSAYGEGLRRQVLWDTCRKIAETGRAELAGSGEEARDFVHAGDIAAAVSTVVAGAAFDGEAYNVASGTATTIRELAGLLAAEFGGGAEVGFSGVARAGDPDRWEADIGLIRGLGWSPEVTISDGAAAYARWARGELSEAPGQTP